MKYELWSHVLSEPQKTVAFHSKVPFQRCHKRCTSQSCMAFPWPAPDTALLLSGQGVSILLDMSLLGLSKMGLAESL